MSDPDGPLIQLGDIPLEIRSRIQSTISSYVVCLFAAVDQFGRSPEEYVGSGTLVTIGDLRFVLTATHVWNQINRFGLMIILLDSEGKSFAAPTDTIAPVAEQPWRSKEWGPDVTFLQLPKEIEALAKDKKVFFNLGRRLDEFLNVDVDTRFGMWAVAAAPAEWTKRGIPYSTLSFNTFFSGIDRSVEKNGYDYLELGFNHQGRPDLPTTYGGVSGAALWHAPIAVSKSTNEITWDESMSLEGVAFYEEFGADNRGFLRCHGRQSIYRLVDAINSRTS